MSAPAFSRRRVYQDPVRRDLQSVVDAAVEGPLRRVLDAGCGMTLPLDFPDTVHLVGLDVSAEELARNENIDEALVGDIQTFPLAAGSFDLVVCWWVLEHLQDPAAAIANMAGALREGGLLVVGAPHPWSLKGMLTRWTPHRVHAWAYRRWCRAETEPFRTYMSRDLTPGRLARIAAQAGLGVVYQRQYGGAYGGVPAILPAWARTPWRRLGDALAFVSMGRWRPLESECVVVFRKH